MVKTEERLASCENCLFSYDLINNEDKVLCKAYKYPVDVPKNHKCKIHEFK